MRRGKKTRLRIIEPYLYLLPTLFIMMLFVYSPFIKTIIGSFFKIDIYGGRKGFVCLANYMKLVTNQSFYQSLAQTFIHTLIFVPLSIGIGLILALVADKQSRFKRIYEVLFCLSMTVSISISCQIFKMMYNPSFGLINKIFGLHIEWLTDKRYALLAITLITVWTNIGFNFIYLSAAIKNVPGDVLESAQIDGAGLLKKICHITIPMISPSLFYLLIISTITGLTMITPVLILTLGGPNRTTETLLYSMYSLAYSNSNYSMAYAYGMVVFMIVAIMVGINFRFEKKSVFYG